MVAPAGSAGREGAGAATRNMSAKAKVQARISCYVIALRTAGKPGRMSGAHFRPAPRVPTYLSHFDRVFPARPLQRTIGGDRYPLPRRLTPLKAILAKFDPEIPEDVVFARLPSPRGPLGVRPGSTSQFTSRGQ